MPHATPIPAAAPDESPELAAEVFVLGVLEIVLEAEEDVDVLAGVLPAV